MTISMNKGLVTKNCLIAGTPVLACFKQAEGTPKPLIILSHGFRGSKKDLKDKLEMLAELEYYAVAIDNRGHGDRVEHDFMSQVFQDGKLDVYQVRRLIKETADDIPAIVDHFGADKQVDGQRIGMLGVSMGGFVTFRALVIEERIKLAAPIIASPYWDELPRDVHVLTTPEAEQKLTAYAQEYSPAYYPERFFPRPILIQIGGKDNHSNGERVKQFYRELKSYYHEVAKRVKLIVHEDEGHEFTEPMWINVVKWFQEYL
jgi:dienelactone hydrolase